MKKLFCFLSVLISVLISLYYMHFGGILGNSSAFSKVGLNHSALFILWGISTYIALSFNIYAGYSKTRFKFYIPLLIITAVGMVLTLACDFDYSKYSQYIAHCIGSITFSAVSGILVFLLFLLTKKYLFTVISGVILVTDLVLLLIFKETALIEIVPIFAGYIMLLITNLKKEKELVGTR
ncbi:MAG: hypothetical protein ACI4IQ_03445 [Eubacterium sp.]